MNSKVKLLDNRKQTATIPKLVNLVNPIFFDEILFYEADPRFRSCFRQASEFQFQRQNSGPIWEKRLGCVEWICANGFRRRQGGGECLSAYMRGRIITRTLNIICVNTLNMRRPCVTTVTTNLSIPPSLAAPSCRSCLRLL